ncbi:HIV Tat-specific factor 1 [Stomoxys calcitrans]|uniref:HIV Tat-specific factor 1 n=1 Tax=Stomoxys calcitrans TaxID=35570 RepID=UPI0027E23CAE|nr:HIV Tat-specific factor 1 [Stomoxys calcitrans]
MSECPTDESTDIDKQETIKDEANNERDSSQTKDNLETGHTMKVVGVNTCQEPLTKAANDEVNAVIENPDTKQTGQTSITKKISAETNADKGHSGTGIPSTENIDGVSKGEASSLGADDDRLTHAKSVNVDSLPTSSIGGKTSSDESEVKCDRKPLTEEVSSISCQKEEEQVPNPHKSSQAISNNKEETFSQEKSDEPSMTHTEASFREKQSSIPPKSSSSPSASKHDENVTYTEDGSAIYTDPATKYQYKWCTIANNWTPMVAQTQSSASSAASSSSNPYENEHYKWCQETQKWIPKQAQAQVTETEHYKWDAQKQEWLPKQAALSASDQAPSSDNVYDIDEDGQRIYTDKDGTVFFWDVEKNAWFPKIDDDFMARYQMSYGFIDNTSEAENEKRQLEQKAAELREKELQRMTEEAKRNSEEAAKSAAGPVKRKAPQEPPKWFDIDPEHNTKVYVSNLPLDITLDEFAEVMGKCGMIMRDPQTQKFKLKLYTEADGQIKGDGLCDYIKVESVNLALKILDEYVLRGHKIRVQPAKFQMRGEYNPALKPKRKKKDKEKLAKIKEKLFDWRPEKMRGERSKNEKTVIIKNLFHPELFEKEVQLILDYQNDLREECSKCGTVRKVVIYDRHSEGIAQINMSSPEEADLVIQMMQGRFFGKRQLKAEHWDGKTKYKIEETEEEIKKRLNKWDSYLETDKSDTKEPNSEDSANAPRDKDNIPEKTGIEEPNPEDSANVRRDEDTKIKKSDIKEPILEDSANGPRHEDTKIEESDIKESNPEDSAIGPRDDDTKIDNSLNPAEEIAENTVP